MKTSARLSIIALAATSLVWLNLSWAADSQTISSWKPYKLSLEEKLRSAACSGDLQEMSRLLVQGAQINATDLDGWTPLIWAATQDRADAVRLLLDRGADVHFRNRNGQTSLMAATMKGYTDVMEILIERGARPDVPNERGWTPLMEASARGHVDAVKLLIARGADPNFKGKKGANALRLAGFYEQAEIAEVLLSKGAGADKETRKRLASLGITGPHARETEQMTVVQYSKSTERRGGTRTGEPATDSSRLPKYVVEALGQSGMGAFPLDRGNSGTYRAPEGYGRLPVAIQSFDPAQNLEQSLRASAPSSRNAKYVEAESLLRQGLEIWNRLRTEYPEVAKRLQEAAASR